MKLAHIPLRVATGAYILNSGLSKQRAKAQKACTAWRRVRSRR